MKRSYFYQIAAFILLLLLFGLKIASAQVVFWTETFENNCSGHNCNLQTAGYTGINGAWTLSVTGAEGTHPNAFFISCNENGNAAGQCGSGCGNDESLHIGNVVGSPNDCLWCPTGDCGAAYDAGGCIPLCHSCPNTTTTSKRAQSPTINCTGKSNITIAFNYIENGQGSTDNATLWYYNGTTWGQLTDMPKTSTGGCGGQGLWTAYSIALPSSANNNANVKIGFQWVNNTDGNGNDPSFAVDDVTLSTPVAGNTPVAAFTSSQQVFCEGTCISFTDQSTNIPTSWTWSFPGGNPSSSTLQNPTNICYGTSGTYNVSLTACNANGCNTMNAPNYISVTPPIQVEGNITDQGCTPDGAIDVTATGGTGSFTYLWNNGATTQDLSGLVAGTYWVHIASGGCTHNDTFVVGTIQPLILLFTDNITSCSAVMHWSLYSNLGYYSVSSKLHAAATWPVPQNIGIIDSFLFQNLQPNTKYDFCLILNCPSGDTINYFTQYIKTLKCTPPVDVTVSNVTQTVATISWRKPCPTLGFQIRYRIANSGNNWTTATTADTFKVLHNLVAGAQYEFQVRTSCGGSNLTLFTSLQNFTTLPLAPQVINKSGEENTQAVNVVPNPNDGSFNINWFSGMSDRGELMITNAEGRKVFSEKITAEEGSNSLRIDLHQKIPPGIYFLQLKCSGLMLIRSFVVE